MAKLKSSTILETIVALVIILAFFGIATTVFVRVTATSMSTTKLRAEQLLKVYAEKTARERLFFDEEVIQEDLRLQRIALPAMGSPNLWEMRYSIYDSRDSLLSHWKSLLIDN
jgi:hypothetical protein